MLLLSYKLNKFIDTVHNNEVHYITIKAYAFTYIHVHHTKSG